MSIDSYFCLCCLSSDDLISLQDGNSEKNYEKMLQYLFTFKPMNEENEADSYICDKCIDQLESTYNFKARVFDTLNILQKQGLIQLHKKDGQIIIKKCSSISSNAFDEKHQKGDENTQIVEKTEICDEKSSVIDIKVDVKSEDIDTIRSKPVVTTVITQPMVKVAMVNAQSYYDTITVSEDENDKEKNMEKESQNQIKLERDKNEETVTTKQAQIIITSVERTYENYEITEDFTCKVCGVVQPNLYVYHTHMNSHMQVEICETCGKGFPNKIKLRRHKYSHQTGPFVCDVCGSEFTNCNTYSAHRQRNHYIVPQYACPHCSQRFKSFVRRARHLQSEHGIKHDYACKQCGKTFLVAGSLSTHIRYTHEKVSCSLCDAAFINRQDLAAHQGTAHDATHNHGCEECGKRFARKNALKVHMRTHTKEKPYGCALCGKYFTQKCTLVAHHKVHNRKGKTRKTLPKKCEIKVEVETTYKLRRDNLKTYAIIN